MNDTPKYDFSGYTRQGLKNVAFPYFYGSWQDADVAKNSFAGQAASVLCGGDDKRPEPHLIGKSPSKDEERAGTLPAHIREWYRNQKFDMGEEDLQV